MLFILGVILFLLTGYLVGRFTYGYLFQWRRIPPKTSDAPIHFISKRNEVWVWDVETKNWRYEGNIRRDDDG